MGQRDAVPGLPLSTTRNASSSRPCSRAPNLTALVFFVPTVIFRAKCYSSCCCVARLVRDGC